MPPRHPHSVAPVTEHAPVLAQDDQAVTGAQAGHPHAADAISRPQGAYGIVRPEIGSTTWGDLGMRDTRRQIGVLLSAAVVTVAPSAALAANGVQPKKGNYLGKNSALTVGPGRAITNYILYCNSTKNELFPGKNKPIAIGRTGRFHFHGTVALLENLNGKNATETVTISGSFTSPTHAQGKISGTGACRSVKFNSTYRAHVSG